MLKLFKRLKGTKKSIQLNIKLNNEFMFIDNEQVLKVAMSRM
jgi:hypothetical protein